MLAATAITAATRNRPAYRVIRDLAAQRMGCPDAAGIRQIAA